MSTETEVVAFVIDGGVIKEATESRWANTHLESRTHLTSRRDIEDAVARVANTPVTGKINEEKL